MNSRDKQSTLPLTTLAYKKNLQILRTQKYSFLAKSQKMATKRGSSPSVDSILLEMDKIAETIK
jgi:hypothetical protein